VEAVQPDRPGGAAPEPANGPGPGAGTPAGPGAAVPAPPAGGPTDAVAAERPATAPKPGRWRIVVVAVAGAVALACTVALGVGYLAYDRVTQPDRSDPEVVVRNFLVATFDKRDPERGRLYACSRPALGEVDEMLADLERKEAQFGVHISVTSEDYTAQTGGSSSTVQARLRLAVDSGGVLQEQLQRWEFSLVRRSGWRVCGAHRTG
jgi:hypothetical protein